MYRLSENQERNRVYHRMTISHYISHRKITLLLILLCSVVHIIMLLTYGCEAEPTFYAFVIYMVLMLFFGIVDYQRVKKKHEILHSYNITVSKPLGELLPEKDILSKDYQQIIQQLEQQQRAQQNLILQREKELSDFYTMWVHQTKTPIAALRLLLQTSPTNISGMKSELFKIERYVDMVLGYLRMDNMNQDLILKHYSLDDLVKQAIKKYSPLFIQSKLSLNLEPLSYKVLTDEKWLVFVIEQLLSNAIKYTPNGSIHIYAECEQDNEVLKTSLIIEDTGIGIYPEDLPRIFERSFTGYNGRMDKKASGLGLYLCKTILQKLGHEIVIHSELHKGTCVTITFTEDLKLRPNLTKL